MSREIGNKMKIEEKERKAGIGRKF